MREQYNIGDIVLGSWTLVQKIGEGSFGRVYKALKEDFGSEYKAAIKIITIPQSYDEIINARAEGMDEESVATYFRSFVEEIVREFALMSKLKGTANVVSYEDHTVIRHEDGVGWDILIRMELLNPLLHYSTQNTITRQDIIKLGMDICRALELCQKFNIVHRDIKPENIFVSELGDFKLGDFGIARTVEKTTSGLSKKGTYTYMAPELYRGDAYGPSVDIYSLGIVLYRLLNNNRAPFLPDYPAPITHSDREAGLAKRLKGEKLPSPKNADGRLAEIVLKSCSFESEHRYSSPAQMRQELEAILYSQEEAPFIYPKGDEVPMKSFGYAEPSGPIASLKSDEPSVAIASPQQNEPTDATVSLFSESVSAVQAPPQSEPSSEPIVPFAESIFCVNCGKEDTNGENFCVACGVSLRQTEQEKPAQEQTGWQPQPQMNFQQPQAKQAASTKERNKFIAIGAGIAAVLVLIIALFVLLANDDMPPSPLHVSLGHGHTMAIKSDGSLWAWGLNESGQLGDGTTTDRLRPVMVMENIAYVSSGWGHTMAVGLDGSLWAWGWNGAGQLGDGTTTDRLRPEMIMENIAYVSSGFSHTMAVGLDGSLWAWGWNGDGQLGDGTTTNRLRPEMIMENIAYVSSEWDHTMAVGLDGSLWAWGWNYWGQLGDGTTTDRLRPEMIMENIAYVSSGWGHTMAIKSDGSLWAWGLNESGQLGDGTTTDRLRPVMVMEDVAYVSSGVGHTMAIGLDGSLWAWGWNGDGQLGDGTTTDRLRPEMIMEDVAYVFSGGWSTKVIGLDGSLWAWGLNESGQLGDGTTTDRLTPIQVMLPNEDG